MLLLQIQKDERCMMRLFNKLVIFSLSVVVVLSGINVYAAPEDVWYSDVMETANKIGIINADEQPEETISNADFIKLAVNFIEDKNDIVLCYAYGIMSGYEDNTFRGRYPATKAEVIATMLNAKAYLNIAEEK